MTWCSRWPARCSYVRRGHGWPRSTVTHDDPNTLHRNTIHHTPQRESCCGTGGVGIDRERQQITRDGLSKFISLPQTMCSENPCVATTFAHVMRCAITTFERSAHAAKLQHVRARVRGKDETVGDLQFYMSGT